MAKLYFYYSAMNAGKTTTLLQSAYNYRERGMRVAILTPKLDFRAGSGTVASRIGLQAEGVAFDRDDDLELLVGLDVTTSGEQPVEETEWAAQILREEAARHRATLIFGHLPIWAITKGREDDVIGDPTFQEMLVQAGAGAYLSGHHHAYFPSQTGGLLQVSQARLGSGPRDYLGTDLTAIKAFGMIDIAASGQIKQVALAGPDFDKPIAMRSLPEALPSDRGKVLRIDIAS